MANYELLNYYYFVWGADPNAHLPLSKAWYHVVLAGRSIGPLLTLVLVPALAVELWSRRNSILSLDGKLLWIGSAPVLMLVLRGAGTNPFVQMPAVFGWLLFALLPFRDELEVGWRRRRIVATLVVVACALNALNGLRIHLDPPGMAPGMQAVKTAIVRMHDDALVRGKSRAGFATVHIVDFGESLIRNVLVFEFGAIPHGGNYLYRGVTYRADDAGLFNAAVPLTWQANVKGRTDEEKMDTLVSLAERDLDYLFLLDEKSLDWAEKNRAFNFINSKSRVLKQRLLATGRWEQVGDPLVVSSYETVMLYRKR